MVLRTPGDRVAYLYDFGDMVHHIELDKVITRPRAAVPRCTAGKRACPPEDCGGPWGYEETLKALRARKGWRYQQARELCATKFDPDRPGRVGAADTDRKTSARRDPLDDTCW